MPDAFSRRRFLTLSGRVAAAATVGGLAVGGAARSWGGPFGGTPQPAGPADAPVAASGAGYGPPDLGRELRIGYLPITDASTLLLAHQLGEFARAGVPSARPVLFRGWDALAQAFAAREVDVVHLLLPMAVQLRLERSIPVRIVSWGHTNGSALTVAPGVRDLAGLAGAKVAIPAWWSVHNLLLQAMLREAGLSASVRGAGGDVELVVMPPAEMVSALASGRIRGFVVAEPFNAAAEAQGVGHVLRYLGDVWRDHGCCGVAVHEELISEHPAVAQAAVTAIGAAADWLGGHRGDAAARLTGSAAPLPQPAPVVRAVHTRDATSPGTLVRHPDWHGERFGVGGFPFPSATASLVELMRQTRVDAPTEFLTGVAATSVHARLVDDRFIRAALLQRGRAVAPRTEEIVP